MIKARHYNILIALIALLLTARVFVPAVPPASASFDCDDSTLSMYKHFSSLGFSVVPVMGNLRASGESWSDCDHSWVIVSIFGRDVAYDWGLPRFDPQYYEAYPITLEDLLYQVNLDKEARAKIEGCSPSANLYKVKKGQNNETT